MKLDAPLLPDQLESILVDADTARRALAVAEGGMASVEQMVDVMARDPVLVARLLRLVNSPLFGDTEPVAEVTRAVIRLGNVVLCNFLRGVLQASETYTPVHARDRMGELRRHGFVTGLATLRLFHVLNMPNPEYGLSAGLLHDFGQIAMASLDPVRFEEACVQEVPGRFLSHEAAVFGLDHTLVGQRLLENWGLPDSLASVAASHHEQMSMATSPSLAAVVVADVMAQRLGYGLDFQVGKTTRDLEAAKVLGLTPEHLDRISKQVMADLKALDMSVDAEPEHEIVQKKRRVWWASNADASGMVLMQHMGLDPLQADLQQALEQADVEDWLVIDPGQCQRMSLPIEMGTVVCLMDASSDLVGREWDAGRRLLTLSQRFTMHDLRWAQEVLA